MEFRLMVKKGINNTIILEDSYSSDFQSLKIALDFLDQQNQHTRKTVILSDILQSGLNETDLYNEIASLLKQNGVQRFIGIGPSLTKQAAGFDMESLFFASTQEFLKKYSFAEFQNESILIKGARILSLSKSARHCNKKPMKRYWK